MSDITNLDVSTNKLIANPITSSRFVIFLDIMGFKERVLRHGHEDVLKSLKEFQKMIYLNVEKHKDVNIQSTQFSDSILLFSQDTKKSSLTALSDVAANIMIEAMQQNIPLKGALAKGKVTCDISKQLFFGQALIDAYLLEEDVKYYGVLVHHTAEVDARGLPSYFSDVKAHLRGGIIKHYELNWYDKREDGIANVRNCLERYRQSVSSEPRKYIDNTLSIISEYHQIR